MDARSYSDPFTGFGIACADCGESEFIQEPDICSDCGAYLCLKCQENHECEEDEE